MGAYTAALAIIVVDSRCVVGAELNACVWAIDPADSALGAFLQVDNRLERSP
jgi:hypothetical protein